MCWSVDRTMTFLSLSLFHYFFPAKRRNESMNKRDNAKWETHAQYEDEVKCQSKTPKIGLHFWQFRKRSLLLNASFFFFFSFHFATQFGFALQMCVCQFVLWLSVMGIWNLCADDMHACFVTMHNMNLISGIYPSNAVDLQENIQLNKRISLSFLAFHFSGFLF